MAESKKPGSPRKRHGDFSKFIEKKTNKKTDKKKRKTSSVDEKTDKPGRKPAQRRGKPGFEDRKNEKYAKGRDAGRKPGKYSKEPHRGSTKDTKDDGSIRLNKYIADAGICSRREADTLIKAGVVKVNGKVVTELGTKVMPGEKVMYGDQSLSRGKLCYVMLNKPKGFITTMDDPYERKTVMSLVKHATDERIYPVGRLDKSTTGLLLFTNDGDLAQRLSHPKHKIRKIYHVELNKGLTKNDLLKIQEGFDLDDGFIKVDNVSYVAGVKDRKEVGVELHSGRNRIVRRIFEELGYKVTRLDRVSYAGMTKKDIPRGKWRHLDEKEVGFLKMIR